MGQGHLVWSDMTGECVGWGGRLEGYAEGCWCKAAQSVGDFRSTIGVVVGPHELAWDSDGRVKKMSIDVLRSCKDTG